jgi:spermidine synthase
LNSRRVLLRVYGCIELGIGIYAALFPFYLELIRLLSYRTPRWLISDLLVTVLTLLAPTFLMGATIPLLVSLVPERSEEVNLCHAKIYGINTLGACLGAFGASFLLIPRLGLPGSLMLASGINAAVGTLFILNRLRHSTAEKEPIEEIPNRFGVRTLYLYTLITGTVTLSLEVVFVRVLNLTLGAGPHNFAIIVGVFIFGLALGSLTLTRRRMTVRVLFGAITFLTFYLVVLFYSVPYWPYWLNNVRTAMTSVPVNYDIYLFVTTGLLLLLMLPFLIPMGFMLPLVYGLLSKSTTDYGKKCGWLYFYNTLGTAAGAIVLSYVLLYFVDLDVVFKIDVLLLAALALILFSREKRRRLALGMGLLALGFLVAPGWDRGPHYVGLFRRPTLEPWNFTGIFVKPNLAPEVLFFDDGPDTTVSVVSYPLDTQLVYPKDGGPPRYETVTNKSLVINGKSDGDTVTDYPTITLAGLLPYFYAPGRQGLDVAVIGMGTGITAGVLGRAEDVARVTVVEIAATLVQSAPRFEDSNHALLANPKIEIVPIDGFKYFTKLQRRLDIVVSATSPPWVVGVENLFTPEFYTLARDALKQDGVFMQWFPLYAMDRRGFRTIVRNLESVFPHLRLYRISNTEMGILAAKVPFREDLVPPRFAEPFVGEVAAGMYLRDLDELALIHLYDTPELVFLAGQDESRTHTLIEPSLSYLSDRARFLAAAVDWDAYLDPRLMRLRRYNERRGEAFRNLLARFPDGFQCDQPYEGPRFFCDLWNRPLNAYRTYTSGEGSGGLRERVQAYDDLRQEGLLPPAPEFLAWATRSLIVNAPSAQDEIVPAVEAITLAYAKDGLWDEAKRDLLSLRASGRIDQAFLARIGAEVDQGQRFREQFVHSFEQATAEYRREPAPAPPLTELR